MISIVLRPKIGSQINLLKKEDEEDKGDEEEE